MYNVLITPCVNVKYISGQEKLISLRDVVNDAHQIKELAYHYAPKMDEFALYKFMVLLLQDVYRPLWEDLSDLWNRGSFDIDMFDTYTKDFEDSGFSFDLLGERPFMQMFPQDYSNTEIIDDLSPISCLSPAMRSGRNDVFFGIRRKNGLAPVEESYEMDLERMFASLIRTMLYPIFTGSTGGSSTPSSSSSRIGYCPSATGGSGSTPVCALYSGKNLFETIILNMTDMTSKEYSQTLPFWKQYPHTLSIADIKESYLNYACVPSARIMLVDTGDGIKVLKKSIKYEKGNKPQELLAGYMMLHDPNVITKRIKDGEAPLTAHSIQRGTYLQLSRLDHQIMGEKKLIYDKLEEFGETDKKISVSFYGEGVKSNSGDYATIYERFEDIDACFLTQKSQENAHLVTDYIKLSEKELRYATDQYLKHVLTGDANVQDVSRSLSLCQEYIDDMREEFTGRYIYAIESGEIAETIRDINTLCANKFESQPVIGADYITRGTWSKILKTRLKKLLNKYQVNE